MSASAIFALGMRCEALSLAMSLLRLLSASWIFFELVWMSASSRSLVGTPGWSG